MNINKQLLSFVKEARRRGFSDLQIRSAMEDKNWPSEEIGKVFDYLNPKFKLKNQICIFLSSELIRKIEKRAKENMFTTSEQIEDILRRSCLTKKTIKEEKLDDTLVALFSRKKR
jgi:hypothetical protein